ASEDAHPYLSHHLHPSTRNASLIEPSENPISRHSNRFRHLRRGDAVFIAAAAIQLRLSADALDNFAIAPCILHATMSAPGNCFARSARMLFIASFFPSPPSASHSEHMGICACRDRRRRMNWLVGCAISRKVRNGASCTRGETFSSFFVTMPCLVTT